VLLECSEKKRIQINERLDGQRIYLRLVTEADCSQTYVDWLNDSDVNQYLETRWCTQTLTSIREFVINILHDSTSYLFAIIEKATLQHIGNIKLGPINACHDFADISYFIGDKHKWGRGYATEAIGLISDFGLNRLQLHRLQAGLYRSNLASAQALKKAGYVEDGVFRQKLRGSNGWEDHIWYCMVR